MGGAPLNDAFITPDEAQNPPPDKMKMFLPRLGFGAKAVVTGDVTQVDLPTGSKSGLRVVRQILGDIDRIRFFDFSDRDVVRHPVVQRIVMAYDRADKEREKLDTV